MEDSYRPWKLYDLHQKHPRNPKAGKALVLAEMKRMVDGYDAGYCFRREKDIREKLEQIRLSKITDAVATAGDRIELPQSPYAIVAQVVRVKLTGKCTRFFGGVVDASRRSRVTEPQQLHLRSYYMMVVFRCV